MAGTLVDILMHISDIGCASNVDKKKLYLAVLDEYREKYPILNEAIRGKFHFTDVSEKVKMYYGGLKPLMPLRRHGQYETDIKNRNIGYLINTDNAIYDAWFSAGGSKANKIANWLLDMVQNPLALGVILGAVGLVLPSDSQAEQDLKVLGLAGSGLIVGFVSAVGKYHYIARLQKEALFLDKIIRETYAT